MRGAGNATKPIHIVGSHRLSGAAACRSGPKEFPPPQAASIGAENIPASKGRIIRPPNATAIHKNPTEFMRRAYSMRNPGNATKPIHIVGTHRLSGAAACRSGPKEFPPPKAASSARRMRPRDFFNIGDEFGRGN
ncbi:hypothetical protein CWE23_02630 [Idiomarina aquatica]|uniref:Uncharacterized protein n=1 Tax=Idiomarina aquatica TaxID=1327752 RepID=A0AA94JDM0_9GAMM|nr:hypothetical protein CWE23_02630 [Idiomarina aquatica]